ncbi:hypothetical protein BDZ45DRAFT_735772 [Acephala macrosclerotiorum]|nr:hypothetical protein BDZ45DRAFT_735772 [Acephala macrosclerotiorum]
MNDGWPPGSMILPNLLIIWIDFSRRASSDEEYSSESLFIARAFGNLKLDKEMVLLNESWILQQLESRQCRTDSTDILYPESDTDLDVYGSRLCEVTIIQHPSILDINVDIEIDTAVSEILSTKSAFIMQFSKLIAIFPLILTGVFSMPVVPQGTDVGPEADSGYDHFHYDDDSTQAATQKRTDANADQEADAAYGSFDDHFHYVDAQAQEKRAEQTGPEADAAYDHFRYNDDQTDAASK